MYLYLEKLVQDLQKHFRVEAYHLSAVQLIDGIAPLPTEQIRPVEHMNSGTLYLCDYRRLRQLDPFINLAPVLCVVEPGMLTDDIFFENRTAVVVHNSTLTEVLFFLNRRMYDYGRLSSDQLEISQSFLRCKTPEDLMSEGYLVLGNPLVLTDGAQKVMSYTPPAIVRNSQYNAIMEMDYLPVGHPDRDSLEGYWLTREAPFLNPGSGEVPDIICKELTIGGSTKGYLHVLQFNRSFQEEDNYIIGLLSNLLTAQLWNFHEYVQSDKEDAVGQFLRDILDDRMQDAETLLRRQHAMKLEFKRYIRVAIIVSKKDIDAPRVSFTLLAEQMERLLPGSRAFLYKNSINVLLTCDEPGMDAASLLAPALGLLEQYRMAVGISNSFSSLTRLREYSYQAFKALQLGSTLRRKDTLNDYRDYAIYRMVEASLTRGGLVDFCMPELQILLDHCRENGPELLDTLRTYLDCKCNKAQTAKVLFTHPNTIKYRIAQIESIMGVSLDDQENIMALHLSFKLLDYSTHFPVGPSE